MPIILKRLLTVLTLAAIIFFSYFTVWGIMNDQILMSITCVMMVAGFGYFLYGDIKTLIKK